ncbi:DUF6924 domain-containing protein [Streptomyces griseoaurantiacus]|uniref:DUF6924 domain-containing protein n=1 Tax=Streptomyces griseoaurantiacus TaxID=68213 RepID=A0A1G7MFF4_9ACTN|nr:hypothetical protein [Streptomyces jietaisiensis]SDF60457.1 hypothetical protein SAMN05216260_109174 [Streptomyces jietaisiensis]
MTTAPLSGTDFSPLLRTDFTDDAAWRTLLDDIDKSWLTVMDDPSHEGFSPDRLLALVPDGSRYPALVVADRDTFRGEERTLLLVDVREEPGRTFRAAVPDAFDSALGNLAIDNQTFDDYLASGSLGEDGVYRLHERHRQALAALRGAADPQGAPVFASVRGRVPGPGNQPR